MTLREKIEAGTPGIRLYGLTPPKLTSTPEELARIAAQQMARVGPLGLDGLVLYDIQDEAERVAEPRSFPFLPTLEPDRYARDHLAALDVPTIVYRCVNRDDEESFVSWLGRTGSALSVLVGAPTRTAVGRLTLRRAYELARQHAPALRLGGVAIAERHTRNFDEAERMRAKTRSGCGFFVTQAVYDVTSTLSLLSDYAIATSAAGERPVPVILTFAPCGSTKTLAFMKWLGIAFPRWLENELTGAADPLATSMKLCLRIFSEVWDYAREKGVPLGVNVESVSIRKVEVEASVELARQMEVVIRGSTAAR